MAHSKKQIQLQGKIRPMSRAPLQAPKEWQRQTYTYNHHKIHKPSRQVAKQSSRCADMHVKDLAARYEAAAKATPTPTPERAPVTTEKVRELRHNFENTVTGDSPRAVEALDFITAPDFQVPQNVVEGNVGRVTEKFEGSGASHDKDDENELRSVARHKNEIHAVGKFEKRLEDAEENTKVRKRDSETNVLSSDTVGQASGTVEADRIQDSTVTATAKAQEVEEDAGNLKNVQMQNVHMQALSLQSRPQQSTLLTPSQGKQQSTDSTNLTNSNQRLNGTATPTQPIDTSTILRQAASLSTASFSHDDSFSSYSDSNLEPVIPPPNITDVDELDHIEGVERVDDYVESTTHSSHSICRNATVEELSEEELEVFSGDEDGFKDAQVIKQSSDASLGRLKVSKLQTSKSPKSPRKSPDLRSGFASSPSYSARSSSPSKTSSTSSPSGSSPRRPKRSGTITSLDDGELSSHDSFESAGSDFPRTAPAGRATRQKQSSKAGPKSLRRADSNETMTTHHTAGSFRLPKAKVVIARKRDPGSSHEHGFTTDDGERADEGGPRKLVRVYENPKDLISGQVSMVDISRDEEEAAVGETPHTVGGGALVPSRCQNPYRKQYDEFFDAEQLGPRPLLSDEDPALDEDEFAPKGASKQRYRSRWFGKNERKRTERHERRAENIQRRSTMLSGALDRVSMAADPWIDFITDNPTAKNKRPWNLMKRLFKRRGNDMIKD